MPFNFVADDFYTKKLCSRLSSSEVRFYTENGRFAFWAPLLGLRGNVRCSSYAHWKARSGLPIVLIEIICWVLPLRRYERISTENRRFRSDRTSLTQNFS